MYSYDYSGGVFLDYKRNQHSVYLLTYHAVFVVKYRKKVLTQEMLDYMKNQVSHLMEGYGGSLIDLNGEADHIHILFELPPRSVLSNLICNLKTQTSRELRANFKTELSSQLWGGALWTQSYFVTTTGGANIETVHKYIQSQGEEKPKRKYTKKAPSQAH